MKSCTNKACQQVNPQPVENFHKRSNTPSGLTSRCKFCKSSAERVRYSDPEYRAKNSNRPHGKYYKLYKKNTCEKCSFIPQDLCQLDVDHIDGDKHNNDPSNLQTLCANCHRLKTKLNNDNRWN